MEGGGGDRWGCGVGVAHHPPTESTKLSIAKTDLLCISISLNTEKEVSEGYANHNNNNNIGRLEINIVDNPGPGLEIRKSI